VAAFGLGLEDSGRVSRSGRASARLEAALKAIGSAAVIVDDEGRVVEANAAARELLASGTALPSLPIALDSRTSPPVDSPWTILRVDTPPDSGAEYLLLRSCSGEALLREHVRVASERWSLTRRQIEVLGMLVEGHSNYAITAALAISLRTVEVHVTALLRKADCVSRSALAARVFTLR
jgi:DNA-binding NarL/FixJ family response regulator